MKKLIFFLLLSFSANLAWSQSPSFVKDSLDKYILSGMNDWMIPGLAIVIVKDGQVVYRKGFGVRDLKTAVPVDEHTLFMIASNSKLFTGTALALLEHRGKLSLNDRIVKFFPDYKLYNDTVGKMVTIRDMLTHRIGTKTFQGDFTFWNTTLSRKQIMNKMRLLKPSLVFRQDYGYCNSCYLTAGEVIPAVTGKKWENFVHDSIISPLEMNATLVLPGSTMKKSIATPYTTSYTNELREVPLDDWTNLAPAASIISSVSDLTNWLMMQLDSGRFEGRRILPWAVLQKTRDVNIMTSSRKSTFFPTHYRGYGLGVNTTDYNGRQVYWHTGGAAGMVSNVCFIPEEKLGIAILTNNDNQSFFELLRYQIMDAYLGVPYVNRSRQQLASFQKAMQEQVSEIAAWKARVKESKPVLPLTAYTGTYSNELYGNITITQSGNSLKVNFGIKPDLHATLDYMDNGEWLMQYNNIEYGVFAIRFDIANGRVRSVTTKQNEFVEYDPYTFIKK